MKGIKAVNISKKGKVIAFSAIVLAICFSVICTLISSCQKKKNETVTSIGSISSDFTSTETHSEVSSDLSATETESQKISSEESKIVSSKKEISSVASVSVSSKTLSSAPVMTFDEFGSAEEWTINIDKSKPVPLQPAVSDKYFESALFVGDSITTGIDLYSVLKKTPVVAYTGINTNTVMKRKVINASHGKVTFLNAMRRYNPKSIYIMMGINGIAFQTKENLISGYSEFIDAVKRQHPNSKIYIQSILPVTDKKQRKDRRFANSKIDSYNKAIAELAYKKDVYYLNVAEAFKNKNGNLPSDASPNDGIHFGPKYYKKWIEYLKRHTVYDGAPIKNDSSSNTSSRQVMVSRPK